MTTLMGNRAPQKQSIAQGTVANVVCEWCSRPNIIYVLHSSEREEEAGSIGAVGMKAEEEYPTPSFYRKPLCSPLAPCCTQLSLFLLALLLPSSLLTVTDRFARERESDIGREGEKKEKRRKSLWGIEGDKRLRAR